MILIELPRSAGIRNQLQLAGMLRKAGRDVRLVTEMNADELRSFAEQQKVAIEHPVSHPAADTPAATVTYNPVLAARLRARLQGSALNTYNALFDIYRANLASNLDLMDRLAPSALLIADDGIACDAILVTAAKQRGVPVFCCPYGYGAREDLEKDVALKAARGEGYSTASPAGDVVLDFFPKWVNTGQEEGRILMRPEVILAREAAGVSIERPWVIYGSEADVFCAPAAQYRDFLVAEGTDPDRIVVTGGPTGAIIHDIVSASPSLAMAFRQPRKIDGNTTKVLVALPASYHADRAHLTEFASYTEAGDAVLRPLVARGDVELTISLHPATQKDDRDSLQHHSSRISDENIFGLIARHDIFVTDFSSTARWAIACGVPTLNYDVYRFAIAAYDDAEGVLTTTSHADYTRLLGRLVDDDAFYAEIAERQIRIADHWGLIDGHFVDRIVDMIAARGSTTGLHASRMARSAGTGLA